MARGELHVLLHPAPFNAKADHIAHVVLGREDVDCGDRFAHFGELRRQPGGIVHPADLAAGADDFVNHRRCRRDEVQTVLPFEALLHDLHMQQAEKAAAKSKAQGVRGFRFVKQRAVIQAQLGQRLAKVLELFGGNWKQARVHLRLHLGEAGQLGHALMPGWRDGVAHRCPANVLDASHDEADFPGHQSFRHLSFRREAADLIDTVNLPR